jgi:hypothetical protein
MVHGGGLWFPHVMNFVNFAHFVKQTSSLPPCKKTVDNPAVMV